MHCNYLFYYLRSGVVHSNQKQSVRLREAHWFPQSPTIVRITLARGSGAAIVVQCACITHTSTSSYVQYHAASAQPTEQANQ